MEPRILLLWMWEVVFLSLFQLWTAIAIAVFIPAFGIEISLRGVLTDAVLLFFANAMSRKVRDERRLIHMVGDGDQNDLERFVVEKAIPTVILWLTVIVYAGILAVPDGHRLPWAIAFGETSLFLGALAYSYWHFRRVAIATSTWQRLGS